jgi:tRNA1Val (adenine37-N6)-methyltransferase
MSIFKLKQFDLKQADNLQKMGSDTMLLGASVTGTYSNILDIGTGTGILALMMAQRNENANVFGIEPHLPSSEEAKFNFNASKYASRLAIKSEKLQDFKTDLKFDLIISNPPYFENSTLGDNSDKNTARHTFNLPIEAFYQNNANLLDENGKLYLIFPYHLLQTHLDFAKQNGLFPERIITVNKENKKPIRAIICYTFKEVVDINKSQIIITLINGKYSREYIALTKDFYAHDLSKQYQDK